MSIFYKKFYDDTFIGHWLSNIITKKTMFAKVKEGVTICAKSSVDYFALMPVAFSKNFTSLSISAVMILTETKFIFSF